MAIVKPFNAVRPNKDVVDKVAALPYDVFTDDEIKPAVAGKPLSFLNIDRPESQFPDGTDPYSEPVYRKAADMLNSQIEDGIYITEDKPCYYLYELIMNGRSQTGIVVTAAIDDYINDVIKKHEKTRDDKAQDRINHIDHLNAQTGPIFLAMKSSNTVSDIIKSGKAQTPLYDFISDDGITHRVFLINDDAAIEKITRVFVDIPALYIADGHHRALSAVTVGRKRRELPAYSNGAESDYFLSVIFPEDELKILPYNRVITDLNGYSSEEFVEKVKEHFDIVKVGAEAYAPVKKAEFGMYLDNVWYKLSAKPSIISDDAVNGLDVAILQNNLLEPIIGIHNPKTDKRIDFIGGIRGLNELENRCANDMKVAFSMYATSIKELIKVADQGLLMPPKSTWFEPKLRSGIFIHRI